MYQIEICQSLEDIQVIVLDDGGNGYSISEAAQMVNELECIMPKHSGIWFNVRSLEDMT